MSIKWRVPPTGGYSFLGNSSTQKSVQIIDRSDEIEIKSPLTQYFNGPGGNILKVAGIGRTQKDNGVQIEVTGPGGTVFGPNFISTTMDGSFSKDIAVQEKGTYVVKFSDAKGYLGTVNFTIVDDIPATPPEVTVPVTMAPTPVLASADSSRESPAYFAVTTGTGPVRIYTSKGMDWVIESTDVNGTLRKINDMGQMSEESVTSRGTAESCTSWYTRTSTADNGTVTLYAENAGKIEAITNAPAVFGNSTLTQTTVTTSKPVPVPVIAFVAALALAFLAARRYSR